MYFRGRRQLSKIGGGGGGGGGLQGRIYRALLRGGTLVEMTSQCTEHTWQNAKHDYLGGFGACPQGNF